MERGSTKYEILDAALTLFSTGGYEATSISQIAEAVGIRKASYSHFASKQDILDELIEINSQPPLQVMVCVSPHKGYITARPKGRYRKLCHWSAIKRYSWNLLFLIPQPALLYISALLHL